MAAMRRERNGAVADDMRFYGAPYGLNYGVSLPTVRTIARGEEHDHEFARFLLQQQVRELRLAAFHIACPEKITREEFAVWGAAVINSEAAEEIAFGLLRHLPAFGELFDEWTKSENPLWVYSALMAAARIAEPDPAWIGKVWQAVKHFAAAASAGTPSVGEERISPASAAHLVAVGAVAVLSNLGLKSEENRQEIFRLLTDSESSEAASLLADELAWRLDLKL